MRAMLLATLLSVLPALAAASSEQPDAAAEVARYRHCLDLASSAPKEALRLSGDWRAEGGGLAARHCHAAALLGGGDYEAAAAELSGIAEDLRLGRGVPHDPLGPADSHGLLADVYAQIGNAWLLAGDPEKAYTAFSQGLAEAPADAAAARVELHIDRARALADAGDYAAALADLKEARAGAAARSDILLYMASAYRALHDLDAASKAIERAIDLAGEGPETLLVRGNIAAERGDADSARRDWQAVITRWPENAAAALAQEHLKALAPDAPVDPVGGPDSP
ncbi:MAG: hypothetical protein D6807_06280 [Alphaproteobacteria bacterium]|nr:MAG: hypothetical protein D6807_06280 [Alphaproteobacteria bacterium]